MADIPILGIPSTYRKPGGFAELLFNQGPATSSASEREMVFVMPRITGSGTWVNNTMYRVKSEKDVIDGAGNGSPIHRALRRALKANKSGKYWAVPYGESTGGAPVKADLTVTWATDPTGTGSTTLWVCGEPCSVGFIDADTVTTIAAAMVLVVNGKTHLPVLASNVAGVVTLTALVNGVSQGDGTSGAIRVHAEIEAGKGTTVATENGGTTDALGLGTGTTGVEGSTTEAANLATALATLDAVRKYYIVTSTWDATSLTNLQTHIAGKSEPNPGHRSVGIAAFCGALAAGATIANARNYERLQLVWQPNSEEDPATLAGQVAAIRQKRESLDSTFNFDFYRGSDWLIPAAFAVADWPDDTDQNDAINDGLTPIASTAVGSFLVYSATTRSKDATGVFDDPRSLETHRISGPDLVTDTFLTRHALQYTGKKLAADKFDAAGNVDPNQKLFPGVLTASTYKPFVLSILDEFEGIVLQNVAASKAGCDVLKDPNNGGRLEVGCDLHTVDLFHQVTYRLAEVSTG